MQYLIPVFLFLFSGWMFWGWIVGERRRWPWLRLVCAPLAVVSLMVIVAGGAFVFGRRSASTELLERVHDFAAASVQAIDQGNTAGVRTALSEIATPQPDEFGEIPSPQVVMDEAVAEFQPDPPESVDAEHIQQATGKKAVLH